MSDSSLTEKGLSNLEKISSHTEVGYVGNDSERTNVTLSEEEYQRVLRKIDLHLLPFVSLLYLLSFL